MPIPFWECEFCGFVFDSLEECLKHEIECSNEESVDETLFQSFFKDKYPCYYCAHSWTTFNGLLCHPSSCPSIFLSYLDKKWSLARSNFVLCPQFQADRHWFWKLTDDERQFLPQEFWPV